MSATDITIHATTVTVITEPPAPGAAGSGDEQAKAELRGIESDEVAVAFGPPAAGQVSTEVAHRPLLGLRSDSGPHRYSATDLIVEVGLGPAPVGLEEAVSAVPR